MQREVVTAGDVRRAPGQRGAGAAGAPAPKADDFKTALMKLIPGETIGVYTLLMALANTSTQAGNKVEAWILLVFLAFGLAFNPIYLNRVANVQKIPSLVLSTLAFAVFVYAQGDWFQAAGLYVPILGAAFVIMAGALLPILAGVPVDRPTRK